MSISYSMFYFFFLHSLCQDTIPWPLVSAFFLTITFTHDRIAISTPLFPRFVRTSICERWAQYRYLLTVIILFQKLLLLVSNDQ